MITFDTIWQQYPTKLGKDKAAKSFKKTVKTEQDCIDIQTALNNYKTYIKRRAWYEPKHGSTWFNNWREWVTYKEEVKAQCPHGCVNGWIIRKGTHQETKEKCSCQR